MERGKGITKIYRSQAEAVVHTLGAVLTEGRYADKEIERTLRSDKRRGSSDRAFIASAVYGVVRYKRLYMYVCGMDAIRSEADVWRLLAAHVLFNGGSLPPWEEFAGVDVRALEKRYESALRIRAVRESIPDWLDEIGRQELPDCWTEELAAMNREAPVVLRANTLRTDVRGLQEALERGGIVTRRVDGCPDGVELVRRANVFDTTAFRNGLFEVQDASSQKVAVLLAPEPGMRVIDACAGGGGKTLHLAALMQGKGTVIAMDVYARKLEELKRRARRAGASNIETRTIEGSKTIKRLEGKADRLLLDVPCSGLGTLRRNPDAKWKLSPEFLDEVTALQHEILSSYCRMVRVGGWLVYSTCSVLPRENERQVERFLSENPGFRLLEQHSLLSGRDGYDGFYMALLERTE